MVNVLTDKEAKIKKAFQIVYDYRAEAKEASQSATETMNSLAEEIGGLDKKAVKKELREAYRAWVKLVEQDDSVNKGLEIATSIL